MAEYTGLPNVHGTFHILRIGWHTKLYPLVYFLSLPQNTYSKPLMKQEAYFDSLPWRLMAPNWADPFV